MVKETKTTVTVSSVRQLILSSPEFQEDVSSLMQLITRTTGIGKNVIAELCLKDMNLILTKMNSISPDYLSEVKLLKEAVMTSKLAKKEITPEIANAMTTLWNWDQLKSFVATEPSLGEQKSQVQYFFPRIGDFISGNSSSPSTTDIRSINFGFGGITELDIPCVDSDGIFGNSERNSPLERLSMSGTLGRKVCGSGSVGRKTTSKIFGSGSDLSSSGDGSATPVVKNFTVNTYMGRDYFGSKLPRYKWLQMLLPERNKSLLITYLVRANPTATTTDTTATASTNTTTTTTTDFETISKDATTTTTPFEVSLASQVSHFEKLVKNIGREIPGNIHVLLVFLGLERWFRSELLEPGIPAIEDFEFFLPIFPKFRSFFENRVFVTHQDYLADFLGEYFSEKFSRKENFSVSWASLSSGRLVDSLLEKVKWIESGMRKDK
eukprot:TRINITY_DN2354_c0_g1_i3.p1 TRINITY_DN2354_c0_g1~~TRINITY_DN2354_c0_g1_i3.p1  ORF type:complete len:437 (-),score=103.68 TRINITY_DN2354_c0_g1_i3:59-1369(-)